MNKLILLVCTVLMAGCTATTKEELTESGLKRSDFQTEVNGEKTDLFVLKNKNKMEVCVTNFGGRIVSVMVPDKDGNMKDVVLGFDSIQDYIKYPSDFGASIGRYANRINQGRFTLDGVEYQLPQNNYGHCLHGGPKGFQYRVYKGVQKSDQELQLTYLAKDGEEGFPGNLQCTVIMTLNADSYTPVDSTFMTTGEIVTVEGTPMDFRKPTAIGANINQDFEQLKNGNGIDHNWVLNTQGDVNKVCATLESPATGIVLDVYTNEPGIQVYCGNFLDGTLTGKKGIVYNFRASVCLETQKYPDTPNKPEWASAVLRPGEKYHSQCIYKFSVRE